MTENLKAARAATRSALFDGIEAQRDKLAAHSAKDETLGTLSPESVEALVASGVLRMKLPLVLGGFEADLVTQMEVLERLAMINPSVGWCAMVGATSLGGLGNRRDVGHARRQLDEQRLRRGLARCGREALRLAHVATD